jgi:CubicO group peptidase (beta-lactamase class C family)
MKYVLGILFTFILILSEFTFGISNRNASPEIIVPAEISSINHRISNKLSDSDISGYIDYSIKRFAARNELKGVSIAILKNEKLVFTKGYGFADKENNEGVTPAHLFRIASISKLVTATAIMKLSELGKLSLTDKIFGNNGIISNEEYMPYKDKRLNNITIKNLLEHSGGWTQKYGDPMFLPNTISKRVNENETANINTYLKFITSRRLHYKPGTMSSYSNMGYVILGEVISRVSNMPYEEFVKKHVLYPIGVSDMHLGNSVYENKFDNEVRYYEQKGSLPVKAFDGSGELKPKSNGGNNITLLGAAGGWIASPAELAKFLSSIDGFPDVKDIIGKESVVQMTKSHRNGFHPLGWRGTNKYGNWWRTGSMPGTAAMMKRKANGISWVFLSNTSSWKGPKFNSDIDKLMDRVTKKVSNWPNHDLFTCENTN